MSGMMGDQEIPEVFEDDKAPDMELSADIFFTKLKNQYLPQQVHSMDFYKDEVREAQGKEINIEEVVTHEACCKETISLESSKVLPGFQIVPQYTDRQAAPLRSRVSPLTAVLPPSPFARGSNIISRIPEWPSSNPSPTLCCRPDVRPDRAVYEAAAFVGVDGYVFRCKRNTKNGRIPMLLHERAA